MRMTRPNIPKQLIKTGARPSPLSKQQVQEISDALRSFYPEVQFDPCYISTVGDADQMTSLRSLGKTNFFTKEIDEAVLAGDCRIGIHSAKDLPDPLPRGISLICLTKGIDPSDSLVLRSGETLESLPLGAVIATSSVRREKLVGYLREGFVFKDLRGTIKQRLAKLETGEADGVVIAEAALIRLSLTHLNRIRLPGETVQGQGQLAILAREDDQEMGALFACLDSRRLPCVNGNSQ